MTGYAVKNITIELSREHRVQMVISVKSLNSRFFETTCRLPVILSGLETELIRFLKKSLLRGHCYLTMSLSDVNAFKSDVEPSLAAIKGYLDALNTIQKNFPITQEPIGVRDLLLLPNIFVLKEPELSDQIKQQIVDTIQNLVTEVDAERTREGAELAIDIRKRCTIMQQTIDTIAQLFEVDIERRKAEVVEKLHEISKDNPEHGELNRKALYLTLDKMDIHEEIVRFKTHLKNLLVVLDNADQEKGKQLDFTLQELGREINTILAKTASGEISTRGLTIKVEIEKAREQAQNIL